VKFLTATITILIIAFLTGCSSDFRAEVKSDTAWSGSFDGVTVSGYKNQDVKLEAKDGIAVAVVQKSTERGSLTVTIRNDSFLGSDGDSKTTTAPYGVVSVSN